MVEITNPRLGIFFHTLQIVVVGALAMWFFLERGWEDSHPAARFIHGNIWVQSSNIAASAVEKRLDAEERLAGLSESLCTKLRDYDYWWDEQQFRYRNISCMFPCAPGQTEGCVGPSESFVARSQGEVFIPTHRTVTPLEHEWQSHAAKESWLLSAEALTIGLSYHYDLPKPGWDGVVKPYAGRDSLSSALDITTVVVHADGSEEKIPPGRTISLTVPKLLELSGGRDALDEPHAPAGANQRPGSDGKPPLARLSGLELEVLIECHNSQWPLLNAGEKSCHLAVHRTSNDWTYQRTVDRGEREVRVYHGIRVVLRGEGKRSHTSIYKLFDNFATLLVLQRLPHTILYLLCITGMGQLSKMYRQATIDTFRLENYLAGMSARLLAWNVAFVELVDRDLPSGEHGISKDKMHERLRAVLQNRGSVLDETEIQRLTDFCFRAVTRSKEQTLRAYLRDMGKELGLTKVGAQTTDNLGAGHPTDFINSDRFSVACTSNEHITFDTAVALFDRDRKRGFLERVFTPPAMRSSMMAEQAADTDPASSEPEEDASSVHSSSASAASETRAVSGAALEPGAGTHNGDASDKRTAVTLEESIGMRRSEMSRFSRVVREYERMSKTHMSHSRELDKHSLALQRIDREHAELKKLVATVQSANEQLAGSIGNRAERMDERQSALEGSHGALRGALPEGAALPGVDTLAVRVVALEAALKAEHAELRSSVDNLHRLLGERVAALELLLEMGPKGFACAEDDIPETYSLPARTLTLSCSGGNASVATASSP